MKKLLVLPFLLLSLVSSGQNFEWVKQLTTSGSNPSLDIYRVVNDANGNIYAAGEFDKSADFNPDPNISLILTATNLRELFLLKLDSLGNLIWVIQTGAETHDPDACPTHIRFDKYQNVIVSGGFTGGFSFTTPTGSVSLSANGIYDSYILKLSSNGDLIWARSFGNTSITFCHGMDIDTSSNLYLTGEFQGTLDIDPGPGTTNLISSGSSDIFISKLDSSGNFIWGKKIGNGDQQTGISLAILDSQIITTGKYWNVLDIDPGPGVASLGWSGSDDIYLLSLNLNGNYNWSLRLGATNYQNPIDIELGSDSTIYLFGYFFGTMDFAPGPQTAIASSGSTSDIFINKFDKNGNFIWNRVIGGTIGTIEGHDIELDDFDNIYLCGSFQDSIDFDFGLGIDIKYQSSNNYFISKIDSSGNFNWVINSEGPYYKNISSLSCYEKKLYTMGRFDYFMDFDPSANTATLSNSPSYADSGFLLKFDNNVCSDFNITIDSVKNISCIDTGYIYSSALNGIPPYSYEWSSLPITFDSILIATNDGIFTLTVHDSIGCAKVKNVLIGGANIAGLDFEVNLNATNFRTGFNSNIFLDGFNDGCVSSSGILSITLNQLVSLNTSIPPPDNISGDTLFWNFTDLTYDSLHITPVINVTTNGQIGDTVCFSVMINPISGDADSSNNYKLYRFPVINGYDPNDKQVYPQGECIPNYVLNGEPLTYTVRFQNTGNADAINIHILDTLDADLDLNSLRVIGNSHYLITEILPGNVMKFRFDNIHLPDSGTNELLSHGYVIYEVKPLTGTPDYTLIENTSHIYFDFNPAIVTNTTGNTLVDSIPTYSSVENISVCYGSDYTLPDGTVYSNIISAISHQSNLWMVDGCDSIITTNISVLNPIDTGVTTIQEIFGLESQAIGLNYQWYDCQSQLPLSGETSQTLSSVPPSEYFVVITDGNCSDTSACYIAGTIGINENQISGLSIYPNPAKNILTIQQNSNSKLSIEILNIEGRVIQSFTSSEKNIQKDVSGFANGMYFINVKSETGNAVFKLVKE